MKLGNKHIIELQELAEQVAVEAGRLIETFAKTRFRILNKEAEGVDNNGVGASVASQVLTEVDIKSQQLIIERLSDSIEKYDLALLSEEQKDDGSRFCKDYFWCIDPLDGTLPFIEQTEGYMVAIALVSKQGEAIIGVNYNPRNGNLYSASIAREGVRLNGSILEPKSSSDKFYMVCDRSFIKEEAFVKLHSKLLHWSKEQAYSQLVVVSTGGAAFNAMFVLEKGSAIYCKPTKPELGGGSVWDFAASACIFNQAGYYVRSYKQEKLNLNPWATTFMNNQGVCFASNAQQECVRHILSV